LIREIDRQVEYPVLAHAAKSIWIWDRPQCGTLVEEKREKKLL
jgi:hypothetical protein